MSEEERVIFKKEYHKKWRLNNKEAQNEKRRKKYIENREEILKENKKYRQENKEAISLKRKSYWKKNRESLLAKKKVYRESKKLPNGAHIVYCLPSMNPPYCGMTCRPELRMRRHRDDGNNTKGWFILQVCESEDVARSIESGYHDKGYGGKHIKKLKT